LKIQIFRRKYFRFDTENRFGICSSLLMRWHVNGHTSSNSVPASPQTANYPLIRELVIAGVCLWNTGVSFFGV